MHKPLFDKNLPQQGKDEIIQQYRLSLPLIRPPKPETFQNTERSENSGDHKEKINTEPFRPITNEYYKYLNKYKNGNKI